MYPACAPATSHKRHAENFLFRHCGSNAKVTREEQAIQERFALDLKRELTVKRALFGVGALGVAIIGSAVSSVYASRIADLAGRFGLNAATTDEAQSSLGSAQKVGSGLGAREAG